MQKRIITLLCTLGLALSPIAAEAQRLNIRPDAPTRYTVRQGDTLWGISGRYLYSPWQWSRLWGANRSRIHNPHLIYPGQVLVLRYVNGQPRLSIEGDNRGIPTIRLRPQLRETSSGYGISTINVNFYRMFMRNPQIIPQHQSDKAPRLVAGPEGRTMFAMGDRIYAYGITEPGEYLIYRPIKDIIDPDTNKYLGQQVIFTGKVATLPITQSALDNRTAQDASELPANQYYTRLHPLLKVPTETATPLQITEQVAEIRNGDFLLPYHGEADSFNMMPHAPSRHVDGKILSILEGVSEAGQFSTITINRGSADGLDKGTVLSLYKQSRQTRVDTTNRPTVQYVSIPAEEYGLAMVYSVGEHVSSAIILESKGNASVGDKISEPGHDLDDMGNDSKHVPNTPQGPYEDHNHYDPRTLIEPTR